MPLKAVIRGHTFAVVPTTWRNRAPGESKLAMREMGSRYLFIVLYAFLEHHLSRGDYRRHADRSSRSSPPRRRPTCTCSEAAGREPGARARRHASRRRSSRSPPGRAARRAPLVARAGRRDGRSRRRCCCYVGRGTGFWFDEWNFIVSAGALERGRAAGARTTSTSRCCRCSSTSSASRPSGSTATCPTGSSPLALHLTCAGLLFAYARPRVGAGARAGRRVRAAGRRRGAGRTSCGPSRSATSARSRPGLGALLALDRRHAPRGRARRRAAGASRWPRPRSGSRCCSRPPSTSAASPGARRRWPVIVAPAALYGALVPRLRRLAGHRATTTSSLAPGYVADAAAGRRRARSSASARTGAARSRWPWRRSWRWRRCRCAEPPVAAASCWSRCRSRSGR